MKESIQMMEDWHRNACTSDFLKRKQLEGPALLEMFDISLFVVFILCLNFHFNKKCMNFHWPLNKPAKLNPAKGLVE